MASRRKMASRLGLARAWKTGAMASGSCLRKFDIYRNSRLWPTLSRAGREPRIGTDPSPIQNQKRCAWSRAKVWSVRAGRPVELGYTIGKLVRELRTVPRAAALDAIEDPLVFLHQAGAVLEPVTRHHAAGKLEEALGKDCLAAVAGDHPLIECDTAKRPLDRQSRIMVR